MWHLEALAVRGFDLGINIASMQEMRADQVDVCLALFDERIDVGGTLLLSNTRDHAYGHDYEYPARWRLLMKRNTPLSRYPHFPIEVFRRGSEPAETENAVIEARYAREVTKAYRRFINDLRRRQQDGVTNLHRRVRSQQQALTAARRTTERHEATIARLEQKVGRLADANAEMRRRFAALQENRQAKVTEIRRLTALNQQLRERVGALDTGAKGGSKRPERPPAR